jgi:hypothetical protein
MKRDQHGIIIQTADHDPKYEDGGDSAFSTGLMAMTGSQWDASLMGKFITSSYRLVRHPYQNFNTGTHPHNDPNSVSRDQTVAFYRGLPTLKNYPEYGSDYHFVRQACLIQAGRWFVNRDILMPDVRMYLYMVAGARVPILLKLTGWPLAFLNLIWDCFIKPDHEMNQSICKNSVYGKWWIGKLKKWHPDLYGNVHEYFDGWRDKKEIGDRIVSFIERSI